MTAASRWTEALAAWAIPEPILAAAPESPWGFPPSLFASAAVESISGSLTPSHQRALEALPERGFVLDVGSGAGAASLPLAPPARRIVAVDMSAAMLAELRQLVAGRALVDTVEGRWPDVAAQVPVADVAVCAHVAYNVGDLADLVLALSAHARHRVVVELTARHPQSTLSPLWQHFWQITRPETPTAADAIAVIEETLGVAASSQQWTRPSPSGRADSEVVSWVRRRLCLPATADDEIAAQLGPNPRLFPPDVVTLWWPGSGR